MQVHKSNQHSKRESNLGVNRRWKRLHTEIRLRGTTPNRFERRAPKREAYAAAKAAEAALLAAAAEAAAQPTQE